MGTNRSTEERVAAADAFHERACAAQRELLSAIAEMDTPEIWRDWGARDMAHWVSMRYGISHWKARRWIAAAHALEYLPLVSQAFSSGELSIDKVVELTRFATADTEARLVRWASGVSSAAIRRRAELEARRSLEDVLDPERSRRLSWWYLDEGRRFGLEAELPAAQGAVVARALSRLAEDIPVMPGEEDACYADARRADALVALCSARIASDPDPDRATVVVHATLEGLVSGRSGAEIEDGPAIDLQAVKRLFCTSRVQAVVEDEAGDPVRLGRLSREPSAWMLRQLRYRDKECRFPGCGARRFTQAHHVVWWENGGRTDLANLVLICFFHHRLVHEHGWSLTRDPDGTVRWFHPDGTRYRAGPGPPAEQRAMEIERQPAQAASF